MKPNSKMNAVNCVFHLFTILGSEVIRPLKESDARESANNSPSPGGEGIAPRPRERERVAEGRVRDQGGKLNVMGEGERSLFPQGLKFAFVLALLSLSGLTVLRCPADTTASDNNSKAITLPQFPPELPAAPGRQEFIMVCVSCHSPRYVLTQPPFSRHKWSDEATKMVKAFGAHASEAQLAQVVNYLVSIDGLPAEASTVGVGTNAPGPAGNPPTITLAANAADLQHGAAVFTLDCAGCHGTKGLGDGIASPALAPRPANLAAVQFSPALLSQVLWNGVPGTCMPSWRDLPAADVNALAAFVLGLHTPAPADQSPADSAGRGKTLYTQVCAACHGAAGDGKSVAGASLFPPPTNFKLEQPDFSYVMHVLNDGIPGTAMPAWKALLSEPDRQAVAAYVRSFYAPSSGGRN